MSLVSLSNVEDMRVEDSSVYCNGTAGGNEVGFEIGPSANAKNEIFKHNNIHTCQFGIYQKSGSMHVLDSEFSSNGGTCGSGTGSDIRIDGTTDVDIIEGNLNEGSTQFINTNNDSGSFGPQHPIIITGNHAAPAGCENTANYWINTANSAVPWFIVANSWDADNNLVKLIGTNLAAGGQATIYAHSNAYPNFLFNQWWAQGNTTISDDLQILQVPMIVGHRVNNGNIPALGNSEPSNFISFRGYFSGSAFNLDDYAIQNIPGGGGSSSVGGTFLIKHQQGVTGTEAFAFDGSYSGISIISMTTPVAPGVTPIGGTGATSYTYAIVAYNSVGNTIGGATTNITNGVAFASLSSTVYNQITFLAQPGATKYCIWRTVGGTTQGNIGCTSALMTIPSASLTLTSACCFAGAPGFAANSSDTQYIFKDTGLAGDSSALPTLNSTGGLQLASSTFANLPTVASGTMLYCSDCKNVTDDTTGTFDSAAASGGHGTMVLRENGAWRVH
jgi:hypothetical protein